MTIESAGKATEESTRQCKEFSNFLKRVQIAHQSFAQSLVDACNFYTKSELYIDRDHTEEYGTVWNVLSRLVEDTNMQAEVHRDYAVQLGRNVIDPFLGSIIQMDATRKATLDKAEQLTKALQETYTAVKRAKLEYDTYHAQAAESTDLIAKAQLGSTRNRKDLDRLQGRAQAALDKATTASDQLRECEIVRNKAQEDYYTKLVPQIYKEIQAAEESKLQCIQKAINDIHALVKVSMDGRMRFVDELTDKIFLVDVAADVKAFAQAHLQDDDQGHKTVSVRSLINPMKAARMQVKRDQSQGWKSRYFVMMEEPRTLYCFDSEDSLKPREVVPLRECQAHSIDDSYFGKPHCIQIILTTCDDTSRRGSKESAFEKPLSALAAFSSTLALNTASDVVGALSTTLLGSSHTDGVRLSSTTGVDGVVADGKERPMRRHVFYLLAESAVEKADWLYHLRQMCYCCQLCATAYGYRQPDERDRRPSLESPSSMTEPPAEVSSKRVSSSPASARLMRRLHMWVMEAKDLQVPNAKGTTTGAAGTAGTGGGVSYCAVLLNEIKQARTSIRGGDSPFWGEDFKFFDLPPCRSRLRVLVFHTPGGKNQKDVEVGYVSINLNAMKTGKRVEEWYHIKTFQGDLLDEGTVAGTIRIAITLTNEQYFPKQLRDQLLEALTEPSLMCIKAMSGILTHQREDFATAVMNILIAHNREVDGITELMAHEILSTDNANIIFRGSTIATKTLDMYMKNLALRWLQSTLTPLIKSVYSSKESCEVDPTRYQQSRGLDYIRDSIKRHWKRLLGHVSSVWDAINKSSERCPRELIHIFSHIKTVVSERFPDESKTKYCAISGFIFLRFFCPAILSPKLFGLMPEHPDPTASRTLTLIAKIMQNLANLSLFEGKEPYMEACNAFIEQNITSMMSFIDQISTVSSSKSQSPSPKPMIDINHDISLLHQFFSERKADLIASHGNDEKIKKLIPIIEELDGVKASVKVTEPANGRLDQHLGGLQPLSIKADSFSGGGSLVENRFAFEQHSIPVQRSQNPLQETSPTQESPATSDHNSLGSFDRRLANLKNMRPGLGKKQISSSSSAGSAAFGTDHHPSALTKKDSSFENVKDLATDISTTVFTYQSSNPFLDSRPEPFATGRMGASSYSAGNMLGSYAGNQMLGSYSTANVLAGTSIGLSMAGANYLTDAMHDDEDIQRGEGHGLRRELSGLSDGAKPIDTTDRALSLDALPTIEERSSAGSSHPISPTGVTPSSDNHKSATVTSPAVRKKEEKGEVTSPSKSMTFLKSFLPKKKSKVSASQGSLLVDIPEPVLVKESGAKSASALSSGSATIGLGKSKRLSAENDGRTTTKLRGGSGEHVGHIKSGGKSKSATSVFSNSLPVTASFLNDDT